MCVAMQPAHLGPQSEALHVALSSLSFQPSEAQPYGLSGVPPSTVSAVPADFFSSANVINMPPDITPVGSNPVNQDRPGG